MRAQVDPLSTEHVRLGASPPPAPLTPLDRRVVLALDASLLVVTAALMVLASAGVTGPLRVLLALAFVTFVPGWAVLDQLTLVVGGNARLALAVALSLTISTLASLGLLWLHLWYPVLLLDVLGAASMLVIGAHLVRSASVALPLDANRARSTS